jgi:hypothetical protein
VTVLETELDRVDVDTLPFAHASLLVQLAAAREAAGEGAAAAVAARAAAAALATLDVVLPPAEAAVLDRLGGSGSSGRAGPARRAELAQAGKWWNASFDGASVRLPDTKGLRYLADLVAHPGAERHALDLVDLVEGVDGSGIDRRALGDAGPLLDGGARAAYRRRIEELRADADDAIAAGRLETAEALQDELDQLVRQLARAFGLGGRERPAASAAERARLNVTRALRTAISHLVQALPEAGAALDRRVRTGLYCAYAPAADDGVRWIVQPGVNGPTPR